MSLINQVLSDLEKRGAGAPDATQSIRAVPAQPHWGGSLAVAAVLALVAAGAGGWWYLNSGGAVAASPVTAHPVPRPAPVQPVMAAAAAASGVAASVVAAGPASQLSLELAAIPVPAPSEAPKEVAPASANSSNAPKHKAHAHAPAVSGSAAPGALKQVSPAQRADAEYEQAVDMLRQGANDAAQPHLEAALHLNPMHAQARQTLAALLAANHRNADAERVLQEGLRRDPKQVAFAMLLARLQVERNALPQAQQTLEKMQPYAGEQADYQAFLAAVLQRENHHEEAVTHYQLALRQSPGAAVWLMGMGISLQALNRNAEARDAYRGALDARSLSAELQRFVEQRLKQL